MKHFNENTNNPATFHQELCAIEVRKKIIVNVGTFFIELFPLVRSTVLYRLVSVYRKKQVLNKTVLIIN